MKRRVLSLIITVALCLNLCPVWASAAGGGSDGRLCPHHPAHTDECGYAPPDLGQACSHICDDGCYTANIDCIHAHTPQCYPDPGDGSEPAEPLLCTHVCTEDSGCVTRTPSCRHAHDEACGYVPENPGAPCMFVCRICPIEDLMDRLPGSVSADNSEQVRAQLSEIYALYDELTADEQQQVDLSPCASLLDQLDGMDAAVWSGDSPDTTDPGTTDPGTTDPDTTDPDTTDPGTTGPGITHTEDVYTEDVTYPNGPFEVSISRTLDTKEFTLTATNSDAIRITATGELDLKGTVVAKGGAGVKVQAGGSLRVTGSDTYIKGSMYALDIASGAAVCLSAGKYYGKSGTAIRTEDGDFAALLERGCAYFDENGSPIPLTDVAKAGTVVVGPCTSHSKAYTPAAGAAKHSWTCAYCGLGETEEACTFDFDALGVGTCACGNQLRVVVDETSLGALDFTDTVKPANGIVTVTLENGTPDGIPLGASDYSVSYSTRAEAGNTTYTVTVTVEGIAYNGKFTGSYTVDKTDQPVLQWTSTTPVKVPYTGSAVTKDALPAVKINITSTSGAALKDYLQYSYRTQGSGGYISGLPTNAGTYDVVVTLPEEPVNRPDYQAASSAPITLVIEKIPPIVTDPAALQPVFNREEQALVTPGTLHSAAAGDGVVIKFSEKEEGPYTTEIPTGTNAGDYAVWYQTEETENFKATPPTPVDQVLIRRKTITPDVTLAYSTCVFDNGYKEPGVTVKDEDHVTVLPDTEYQVTYKDNKNAGQATVTVSDRPLGNYEINPPVEVHFQITSQVQAGLSIINQPSTVTYGDQFILSASGGSGNGRITWEITSGTDVAEIDAEGGQVTIIGHGKATVKVTKSGADPDPTTRAAGGGNYEDATATWTLTAAQKPVTATVTAEDRDYIAGDRSATVHAVVEQGVLPGDEVTITGLTGTFDSDGAGADKAVAVDRSQAAISGENSQHYSVFYSSDAAPVKATIRRAVAEITAVTAAENLVYDGTELELITGAAVTPGSVQAEYALSQDGPYDTALPKAVNAGTYTVWYRIQETENYTGLPPASIPVTIAPKPVAPDITLSPDSFVYDGTAKEPGVTLTEADGTVIPSDAYTVAYSGNVDAGTATVTVTAKDGGNYSFAPVKANFTIGEEKAQVTTAPEAAGDPLTFSNRAQKLVTAGAGTGGTMVYRLGDPDGDFLPGIPVGTNAGDYKVYYKVAGDANHSDSDVGSVDITIAPKTVKDPPIELFLPDGTPLVSYIYDGTAREPKVVVKDGSTVIDEGEYNVVYGDNRDAGKATVSITNRPDGNYTVTGSATFVIEKADIAFDPDPAAADITYDGKPHELLEPGVTSGGEVLYALNSETSTYTAAIPAETEAGTYTVYYKVVGDRNHNDFPVRHVDVTIKQKPLTAITIELTPLEVEFDGTAHLPKVTVKDGETVLPEREYQWTCTPSDPVNVGTYTVTIAQKPGVNYDLTGVTGNTATFTIGKTAQTELVIGGKPSSTTYGDSFQLTVSGGDGNGAVVWSVTGPATVDEDDGSVAITGVGEVTVTVEKGADTNYNAARAQYTFTAVPKPVTATIAAASRPYDGTTDAEVTSATVPVLADDTVEIVLTSITAAFDTPAVGTGKTVALDTGSVQVNGADAAKYDIRYPASVKADITARQVAAVTVALSDIDLKTEGTGDAATYYYEYDGTVKTPAVTVTGDGAVIPGEEYTVNYTGNRDAGTATVTVTAKPDGNYSFAEAKVTFTIKSASARLTSSPQAKSLTYEKGVEQELVTVGTAEGGTVWYSDTGAENSYSAEIPKGENAGIYTVYYMVKGDANHSDTAPQQVTVTIRPKEITSAAITLGQESYEYTGAAFEPVVTVKDGSDTVDSSNYTVSYRDNTDVGTATVIVSAKTGVNYTVNGTKTFQITRKAPVFTAPTAKTGLQYSGELQELVNAGSSGDGSLVYSVNGGNDSPSIPTASAVGTYQISYKVLGDRNHSDIVSETPLKVVIGKNVVTNPTITLSSDTFTFNNSQQKPTITVKDDHSRLIPETEYRVAITGTNGNTGMVDADTYTIRITTPDTSNYVITDDGVGNVRTFTIKPADQETISITGAQAHVSYGDVIQLGATGGTGNGTVEWTVAAKDGSTINSEISQTGGLLTVKDVGGPFVVTVTRSRGGNYSDVSATWEFSAGKRPVTAVLTGVDRDYRKGDVSAAVKAKVDPGDLVFGDTFDIPDLTGTFDSETVGTGKTVTITGPAPTVSDPKAANYAITYPATATASILAVPAAVTADPDAAAPSLTYDAGKDQALVTAGTAEGGIMVYSLDGTNFATAIPRAKDAGNYTVSYKVQGDQNHTDSVVKSKQVTIARQTVVPQIELNPSSAQYDGNVKRPQITVRDTANHVIPESEYTVAYDPDTDWKDVGDDYTVIIQNAADGNYIITETSAKFTISTKPQNPLEIVNKPDLVYYGDTFRLSAVGGSVNDPVTWQSSDTTVADIDAGGLVTIKGTGPATITAKRAGGTNYDAVEASYPLHALPKPVTAVITADDREYISGNTAAVLHVSWEDGALVGEDEIQIETLTGTFADDTAGVNKTVTIHCTFVSDATAQKYDIKIPATTTASIRKAVAPAPALTKNERTYDGTAQPLVTGGNAGTTLYSDSRDGVYSTEVPQGTGARTYTVWYMEKGDANHSDSEPQAVQVTIQPKTLTADASNTTLSGSGLKTETTVGGTVYYYEYDGGEKTPAVTIQDGTAILPSGEYTVRYSNNTAVSTDAGKATVAISNADGGNYLVSGSVTFEIRRSGAQLISPPQKNDLTYTGQAQALVTPGSAAGGHMEYAVNDGPYGSGIPTETDAGTYTVHYKVVPDSSHQIDGADSTAAGSLSVTIRQKEIVSPKVTVSGSYVYDGTAKEPASNAVRVEDGTVEIPSSEYTLSYQNNVNAGTATVIITNANGGNYIVNGTATFEIAKAGLAASDVTAPSSLGDLPYNGTAQELVRAGSASGGTMVYSLSETGEYSAAIPTGKEVKPYTVWYMVQGDGNHKDSAAQRVDVEIVQNNVAAPRVQVVPDQVTFTGEAQRPAVTVRDDSGLVIDGSEYTVAYTDSAGSSVTAPVNADTYTLTITGTGGNYIFTAAGTFTILPADQAPLRITGQWERVCYGDTIPLGTEGGNGTVEWKVDVDSSVASITAGGLLTIKGVGPVTVTATSTAAGYADQTATWPLYAEKRQASAVVTAADRPYNGDTDATLSVTISGLVLSDRADGATAKGHFTDKNVGTNKTVVIDSLTIPADILAKYDIPPVTSTTAAIFKADVADVTAPAPVSGLKYTGLPQNLVTAGSSADGTMEYSLDNITYSTGLPAGTDAGGYDIWYRVKGDGNHNDMAAVKLTETNQVSIAQQVVGADELRIEFNPSGASFDGQMHRPAVTVLDKNVRVIPDSEYTVDYGSTDWIQAGEHKVTIKNNAGGNYVLADNTEAVFTISQMGQNPLSIGNQPGRIQYGDTFTLTASGGSGTGAVTWDSSNKAVATIQDNGLVEILKSGSTTITATKAADGNYGATTVTWSFRAEKKAVTPIVTADGKVYDGDKTAVIHITWRDGDLLGSDTIALSLTGAFNDANVGTNKTVTLTGTLPSDDRYDIRFPAFPTASITPKAASATGVTAAADLEYTGSAQPLVSGGTAANGTLVYSRDGSSYSQLVPTGRDAGTYPVWYKAQAEPDGNYKDSPAVRLDVTIRQKEVANPTIELSPETFDYDGSAKRPDVVVKDGNVVIPNTEYTVSYSNNTQIGSATVTVSNASGGNYIVGGAGGKTASFTIKAGNAVLTVVPRAQNLTYNGTPQALVTEGVATNGRVVYYLDPDTNQYSDQIPTATNAGSYTVWYKVESDNGTSDTSPRSVPVTIQKKPVNPVITLLLTKNPAPYTGNPVEPPLLVSADNKMLTAQDYNVFYSNNRNVGTATVLVWSKDDGNYQFSTSVTFEIVKAAAEFTTDPTAIGGLTYNGREQQLVNAGEAEGGTPFYSLDGVSYFALIPTKTDVGRYTVYAKVMGDSKHGDSDPISIPVQIGINEVEHPTVELSDTSFDYTGSPHKPTVTVYDDSDNIISSDEYTVKYSNNTAVGTAKVEITSKEINYRFTAEASFEIVGTGQSALTITGRQDTVLYGDTLPLGVTGGSGDGAVTWRSSDTAVADIGEQTGVMTIRKSGSVTITATKAASGSYGEAAATWTFVAKPRPVTAVVTAASRPYDGTAEAALTVTITGGLVNGETINTNVPGGVTATGAFADGNAGTGKTVTVQLNVPEAIRAKYDISCNTTTTASITQKAAAATGVTAKTGLVYTGSEQPLLESLGTAEGGTILYSVDNGRSFDYGIPMGTDAKTYSIWYKVAANDGNYKDSAPEKAGDVAIAPKTIHTLNVQCRPNTFPYDGTEKSPDVVVMDQDNNIIPDSAYTVALPSGRIAVGAYTVTVTGSQSGNYHFTASGTGTFQIVEASQNPLSIVTDQTTVYYGDLIRLTAMGGSGSGDIQWSVSNPAIARIASTSGNNCVVKVTGKGGFTVEAYRDAKDGYGQSNTDTVLFDAKPKPVTPVVTADNKPYDGTTNATLRASWENGVLEEGDTIDLDALVLTGTFDSAAVGTNKRVMFTPPANLSGEQGNYFITWPRSAAASIDRVDAELSAPPQPAVKSDGSPLTYTGAPQALVTGGSTKGSIGKIVYSLEQNGTYSESIPTGKDAGEYTVWYKVADSVNYTGFGPSPVRVEIKQAAPSITTPPTASGTEGQLLREIPFTQGGAADIPGTFAWTDAAGRVEGGKASVTFTPEDRDNYSTVEFQIDVTVPTVSSTHTPSSTPGGGTAGAPMQTTVRNGAASTVVSPAAGSKLVQEAAAKQSASIVIEPEITSNVTKAQVSIPASTVSQIRRETDAALTIAAPIADVTIPQAAMDTLSSQGGTVDVVTERVDQAVVLTLTANGEAVESLPGGVTLSVPAEDAGPGTVAVRIHEDGTREVIQKSTVEDGRVNIPLDGSATVEIVDNSREFTDVPSTSWAADAVAFASAHELFSGTSETTFSPDQPMSRGMLATVLYNLDGQPDQDLTMQDLTDGYSDVTSGAWYAEGVAWVVENGIANGYGNGEFGPNDSITREQLAVMLWKYAGSPAADRQDLDFTDANQASGYAQEALRWAVETGIINGYANGQLAPGGTATRAQAAQMLKNFMENT